MLWSPLVFRGLVPPHPSFVLFYSASPVSRDFPEQGLVLQTPKCASCNVIFHSEPTPISRLINESCLSPHATPPCTPSHTLDLSKPLYSKLILVHVWRLIPQCTLWLPVEHLYLEPCPLWMKDLTDIWLNHNVSSFRLRCSEKHIGVSLLSDKVKSI